MLDDAAWEQANAAFLSDALAWLRERLERFPHHAATAEESAPSDVPRVGRRNRGAPRAAAPAHLPFDAALDPPPALIGLGRRFALSAFELDVLLLCVAMELDTRTSGLCARVHDDPQRAHPTFALALSLFDEPAWEALSPERPLRFWRLIEIGAHAANPLTTAPLRADDRIVNFVKGLNHLDERLMDLVVAVEPTADDGDLPPTQQRVAESIFRAWKDDYPKAPAVVKLVGPDSASSSRVATEVAAALGRRLFRVHADSLPRSFGELDLLARLWRRESALLPVALYIDAHDVDGAGEGAAQAAMRRFIARAGGFTFLAAPELSTPLGVPTAVYDVAKPAAEEQRRLWEAQLGAGSGATAVRLVSQFNLDAATIATIVRRETQLPDAADIEARLWNACRAALRPELDALAQRLDTKARWDDLILPEHQRDLLQQIAAQVPARHQVYETWGYAAKMNRGFGVTALFAGESGTGKTMSAEVIANALSLSLYRIDLSAVVSKYIGETEKNLRRVFDAADDGGAILFFDEADALFGKRSEVRDSHDRYANIETNYLLQRMEGFRGLAILATNMKSSLDVAFTRRLRFIVNFPHPGSAERTRMWERAFPAQALAEPLDAARLAKLNLTGAAIASAALNAAFLAVRAGEKVTLAHVLAAVRQEFIKTDRPVNEVDFLAPSKQGAA
jgi:hypothetical protein